MIYALLLENSKYYVGHTSRALELRIEEHLSGKKKTSWLTLYKPIKIIESMEGDKKDEKALTLKYMLLYGWENVRGGPWTGKNVNCPQDLTKDYVIVDDD